MFIKISKQQFAYGHDTEWLQMEAGVPSRMHLVSSAIQFVYRIYIVRLVEKDSRELDDLSAGGQNVQEIRYADDTVPLSTTERGLNKIWGNNDVIPDRRQ